MKQVLEIINQLTNLEQKLLGNEEYERSFNRIKQALIEMGYSYSFPIGETYNETRTDVEASIVGETMTDLVITKVIKPIVIKDNQIAQRGVVIVESKK
jgi:uncharacterized protein YkuJ